MTINMTLVRCALGSQQRKRTVAKWAWSTTVVISMLAGSAAASNGTTVNGGQLLREQKEIQQEVEKPSGKYSRLKPAARQALSSAQQTMFDLLGRTPEFDQLSKEEQVRVFNAQEVVRSVLVENEDDRLICKREKRLGTTIKETVCATVAERRDIAEGAKDWKGKPGVCAQVDGQTGCGSQEI